VEIARTRTLAKLISDTAKPFGALAVLDGDSERELLAWRPVTDITGIADRRARRPVTDITGIALYLVGRSRIGFCRTSQKAQSRTPTQT
jgi:hypothetical protein